MKTLPAEIVQQILLESVHIRGLKRALRLRLVNRYFADAALHAVFDSQILDESDSYFPGEDGQRGVCHRYVAYRVLSATKPRSKNLNMILKVAQRLLRQRSDGTDAPEEDLRQCVMEISRLPFLFSHGHKWKDYMMPDGLTDESLRIDGSSIEFNKALLTAAAFTNDLELVIQLVKEGFNHHDTNAPSYVFYSDIPHSN